ncbi:leucyl/phenylalanyl-tRNA--protein transferase [Ferruginibacter yonginensis]|uniref:Leucyl/phenylalanyl-tRNA--protein transferase n=1 Tax=Ferruginibacter yonginensis TaxID=1310416 RepID=A0ABV8QTC1_9BACT
MNIAILNENNVQFPHPSNALHDGLLAIGGNLLPATLIAAYQQGIFPWYSEDEPICWYAPHERCVIFPDEIVVSKSTQQVFKKNTFRFTINKAFTEVVKGCKFIHRKDQDGTWINNDIVAAYEQFHQLGYAKSVEVWQDEQLVGGLYGVVVNNVFCGESMFSKVSNASKAALIWLCKQQHYQLIDCQVPNEHLISLGATMIPQAEFLQYLQCK